MIGLKTLQMAWELHLQLITEIALPSTQIPCKTLVSQIFWWISHFKTKIGMDLHLDLHLQTLLIIVLFLLLVLSKELIITKKLYRIPVITLTIPKSQEVNQEGKTTKEVNTSRTVKILIPFSSQFKAPPLNIHDQQISFFNQTRTLIIALLQPYLSFDNLKDMKLCT